MDDATAPGTSSNRTPGELLRHGREARGLSVADVSEHTKIPPRLVEAMERDEYHKLSGNLYVKSFLRAYAGCVGLDPEALLAIYEPAAGAATEGPPAVAEEPNAPSLAEETTVRRVGVPWLTIGAVVVALGLGGWLIWRLFFANQGG